MKGRCVYSVVSSGTTGERTGHNRRVDLRQLQQLMVDTYGERDRARGVPATVAWLTEELGELAQAVRKGDRDAQLHELGDVLAWLASLGPKGPRLQLSVRSTCRIRKSYPKSTQRSQRKTIK